ncbi:hypothetical protein BGZ99_008334 [Dissophora globulifera]|uniref:Uncharacterized protein n=1 Tax=Dissophora globulifera TaxID=979702 RepID=A0A9P6RRA2_9FUNG|nr:hypothetical protein BGZ99_008334 [Dissophora globulifera]
MEEETPRERFLSSQEILSTIDWADVLQDHSDASEAITLFDKHMTSLLDELTSKKFSRFLKDAVLAIARPIKAFHRVREFISAEPSSELARSIHKNEDLFESLQERILQSVFTLVSRVVERWDSHQMVKLRLSPDTENELNNQHYLLIYLILLLLDQWVAPDEIEASSTYFEYEHPKYKRFSSRGPNAVPESKKDTRSALRHLKTMMDLSAKCRLSIEDLLVWKPAPGVDENDDSYDEEALLEDNYPLSETGITTLVAGMIFAMICPSQLSSTFTLPLALAQNWVFTNAGGLASGFLTSDETQLPMADKALMVLQYAIDRTPLNRFEMEAIDYCSTDSSLDRMGLFQIFQVMVSFAATCPSASHRFFCFQALDRLIQACEDDVKMYLLEQLVSPKCPYESMRAAAVNLVKSTIERAFTKLDESRATILAGLRQEALEVKSPFTSPLLLKTFEPSIWRFEAKAFEYSPLRNERVWLDKYDMFMHALNCYLFLLMRDSREDNLTEIWSTSNVRETHREFIEPLVERVQELKEDFIQRLEQAEMTQDTVFADTIEPSMPKIKSKNGVVNFDIDMESEDEDESNDEDGPMGKKGGPKDTVIDLNQKMMQLEIMDELLERIQDLTAPLTS